MFANFGQQVKGIRGADAQVRSLKDVGEYDVFTYLVLQTGQTNELLGFTYAVGGQVSGAPGGVNATKLETNMRVQGQFVNESMLVYAIAVQLCRLTDHDFQDPIAAAALGDFTTTLDDFRQVEEHMLFRMHVGGDKPFAEGLYTWFAEAGGIAGFSNANNGEVLANNVATIASARRWEYKLPIGRIEKFWAECSFYHGGPAITNFPDTAVPGHLGLRIRLLGVRARGVQ